MLMYYEEHIRSSAEEEETAEELDLSCSDLRSIDPVALSVSYQIRPELIQKLILYGNDLTVLPATIVNFVHLRHLDVSSNNISWITGEITQLKLLRILVASNNRLSNLPKQIETCVKMKVLNLSGNQYQQIPMEVFKMIGLKELYFGGNQICMIQPTIQNLESLEVLYLGGNNLRMVPPQLKQLKFLRHLILCDNQLEVLPSELGKLKHLESLSLHKNQLKTLPMEIIMLLNLQELTLRDNPLVNKFIKTFEYNPPTLLELSGRAIKTKNVAYNCQLIPRRLVDYLNSARRCVNPKCDGVYFDCRIKCVQFVDFCGKFRLPLEQYLCSPCDSSCCTDSNSTDAQKMLQKLYLPLDVVDSD